LKVGVIKSAPLMHRAWNIVYWLACGGKLRKTFSRFLPGFQYIVYRLRTLSIPGLNFLLFMPQENIRRCCRGRWRQWIMQCVSRRPAIPIALHGFARPTAPEWRRRA
jgi:hypothetical protein